MPSAATPVVSSPTQESSSSPCEGRSCCSETKHDRRTAPRTKLFVSKRSLQRQGRETRKTVLLSSPDEDNFCRSESKHDKRAAQRTKLFVSASRLQGLVSKTRKTVLGWSLGEDFGFGDIISFSVPVVRFQTMKIDKKLKNFRISPQ
jgi:hypothetical protein